MLIAAIAYFILPLDVIPEELEGPYGYVDDIFFCAYAAHLIAQEFGDAILIENWDGECPLIPLINDILAKETDLIADQRKDIFAYVGLDL